MKLRLAERDDAERLFEWRNDSTTRLNSISSEPVSWPDHVAWLEQSLSMPERALYVAEVDGEPIGTVRLDLADVAIISITVAPEHRGRGLAVPMIEAGCDKVQDMSVVAEIRPSNVASIRAFERAGFVPDGSAPGLLRYWLRRTPRYMA